VGWRSAALLAGQITGVAPDVAMALTPTWKALVFALGCGALVVFLVLTLPLLRKNPYARYWFTVMVLAAVPASTVVPLSKNLGFVAVGAFGLISCFVAGLADGEGWVPRWLGFRALAWTAAGLLVLAHGPIAALGRVAATQAAPQVFEALGRLGDIGDAPELGDRDVIVLNAPCQLALFASPFARQYRGQPVPRTLRSLLPGCTAFEVRRSDANTLVAQSSQPDIFSCGNLGPVHSAYAFNSTDRLMARQRFQKGERVSLEGLTVEVLETDGRGQPSRVAFHFTAALESLPARWLFFDWSSRSYRDFPLPPIGEHVRLAGPKPVRLPDLARQALRAQSGP
jgi:hypothetical protein